MQNKFEKKILNKLSIYDSETFQTIGAFKELLIANLNNRASLKTKFLRANHSIFKLKLLC